MRSVPSSPSQMNAARLAFSELAWRSSALTVMLVRAPVNHLMMNAVPLENLVPGLGPDELLGHVGPEMRQDLV